VTRRLRARLGGTHATHNQVVAAQRHIKAAVAYIKAAVAYMRCRIPALPSAQHAATASMAALRAAARDQHCTRSAKSTIDPATTRTDSAATRKDGLNSLWSSHCSRDLLRQFLRSSQTTPAPRIITAPIAINQVKMPKIAPTVPYVLLSETIVSEK
jgi:hypothetical protein